MRTLAVLFLACFVSAAAIAQDKPAEDKSNSDKPAAKAPERVPSEKAKTLIGTNAIVFGKIVDVHKTDKAAQLNFDNKYPKQTFTAVIFSSNFAAFTNANMAPEKLEGKTVEVRGKIVDYHGRPEVILNSTNQIKILPDPEKKAGATDSPK